MSDSSAGTVVLVHGGFVDGSGWQGVYQKLTEDGYTTSSGRRAGFRDGDYAGLAFWLYLTRDWVDEAAG
jgi:hypothetical protein